MKHSSWRAYSRIGIRWLGVSALVGGRVCSALISAGGISVTGLPVAALAVDLIAVEVALAEEGPNTISLKTTTTPADKSAASESHELSATEVADRALPNSDAADSDSDEPAQDDVTPLNRLPPGGWQSEPITIRRR